MNPNDIACSACKRRAAIFFRPYSGQRLCKKCFVESIEAKVRATIARYNMFSFSDKIAVAVSGGKDSLNLLQILAKIEHKRPKASLVALTVDEGIKGYRDEALKLASAECAKLGVDHRTVSFKKLFGFTLNELVDSIQQVIDGKLGPAGGEERESLIKRYLAGQEGALACERMLDVLQAITEKSPTLPAPALHQRISGIITAQSRFLIKRMKSYFPGSHAPPEFHRHRYPGITLEDLRRRIRLFQQILRDETSITAEAITPNIFRIRPTG